MLGSLRRRLLVFLALLTTVCVLSPENLKCVQTRHQPPPPTHFEELWSPLKPHALAASKKCRDFILYTVVVSSSRSEAHHTRLIDQPDHSITGCAYVFLLKLQDEKDPRAPKDVQLEVNFQHAGWQVISHSAVAPSILARRLSRFPKLDPFNFFPETDITLYCDTKYIALLSKHDVSKIAKRILNGTQFGIVQHPSSANLQQEYTAILRAYDQGRPLLDSAELLEMQHMKYDALLTNYSKYHYVVNGGLHAHARRHRGVGSKVFDDIWLQEYLTGSDRDQISFFGAASRMFMVRTKRFSCDKFDRSGIYISRAVPGFKFAIHCEFSSVVGS